MSRHRWASNLLMMDYGAAVLEIVDGAIHVNRIQTLSRQMPHDSIAQVMKAQARSGSVQEAQFLSIKRK
jgi:hypothetical protein